MALILFFIEWIRGAVFVAYLPAFILASGYTAALTGITVSVHYLTDSLFKGLAGYLLDRFPVRVVLHGGFVIGFLGLVMMITADTAWMFIAASACLGAGLSPIWIVCMGQITGENRAQRMGELYIYWMAGLGLGPVTTNLLIGTSLPLTFWMITGIFVIAWVVLSMIPIGAIPLMRTNGSLQEQLGSLWQKMKAGKFLIPGMMLQTTAAGILVPYLTSFAVQHLGLTHSELSVVLLAGGAGVVLFLVPMGKWFDRIGSRWFLVLGFAIFSASLFQLTFIQSFLPALLLALLLGSSYAALLPSWNALMSRYIPEDAAGMGWGVLFSIEGLGVVIGPLIGSWLSGYGNESLPFWVSACLFGVISLCYLLSPAVLFSKQPIPKPTLNS